MDVNRAKASEFKSFTEVWLANGSEFNHCKIIYERETAKGGFFYFEERYTQVPYDVENSYLGKVFTKLLTIHGVSFSVSYRKGGIPVLKIADQEGFKEAKIHTKLTMNATRLGCAVDVDSNMIIPELYDYACFQLDEATGQITKYSMFNIIDFVERNILSNIRKHNRDSRTAKPLNSSYFGLR